ncbi:hypothetical protein D3C86_1465180 [compost metagenome]
MLREGRADVIRHAACGGAQRLQAILHRREHRGEGGQTVLQGVDGAPGPAQMGVKGHMRGQQAQLCDVQGQPLAVRRHSSVLGFDRRLAQQVGEPLPRIAKCAIHHAKQGRGQAGRKRDAVDHAGTQDAQPDFSDPCDGRVEHRRGRFDQREADQSGRVASQHEDVRTRAAVQQRHIQAQSHPQRQGQRQELRGPGQRGNEHHGCCAPQQGAHKAVERL